MGRGGVRTNQSQARGTPGPFGWGQVCLTGWWEQVAPTFLVVEKFFVPAGSNWGHCWPGAESPLWVTKAGDETPGTPMAGNVPALALVRSGPQAVVLEAGIPTLANPTGQNPKRGVGTVLAVRSPDLGPSRWGRGFHACLPVPWARTQDLPA